MTDAVSDWPLQPVLDWLLDEGRFLADGDAFTAELGERLLAAGAPITRLRLSTRILHPLYTGWSAVWEADGTHEQAVATHGLEQRAAWIGSPLAQVQQTGRPFRRRLEGGLDEADHTVLNEFAAGGATDYLALPLRFFRGRGGVLALVSDRRGGFGDGDVARFEALARTLAPIVETAAAHHLARSVAEAYIGPRSGARVLDGRITRGDVEVLRAAIWFSDIRGWSRMANELPAADAVALANAYFELVDGAVTATGGEVLKLIGDAVLAIFPVEDDAGTACRAALDAAATALERARSEAAALDFGVGLHIGEIVYGNVGSPTRLDFTVMGRAVNLAARIEMLTRTLGLPVILSKDLTRASGRPCTDLGLHTVAGWDAPVRVFAPNATGP
jgi:adenylate cyclase